MTMDDPSPDDATIVRAHAFANETGEAVACVRVPDGPLLAVFGRWLLCPFSDIAGAPGVEAEWNAAPYVALPGEALPVSCCPRLDPEATR